MRVDAYVDGSYSPIRNKYGSGAVLIFSDGREFRLHYGGEIMDKRKQKIGSLIGELKAAEMAVAHAVDMGCSEITLHYDYYMVEKYAVDPPKDNSEKELKAYNERMRAYMKRIPVTFNHVKAHSGDKNNAAADQEARIGAGISAVGIEDQTMAEKMLNEKTDFLLEKYSDEENIKKMAPVRFYSYACMRGHTIYYALMRYGDEKKTVSKGKDVLSTLDAAGYICDCIVKACQNEISAGAKNIVIFSEYKNIIKYGNKAVNENSRKVNENYKGFSKFCMDSRKDITLSIERPESAEDIARFNEVRDIARKAMIEEKGTNLEKDELMKKEYEESEKKEENEEKEPIEIIDDDVSSKDVYDQIKSETEDNILPDPVDVKEMMNENKTGLDIIPSSENAMNRKRKRRQHHEQGYRKGVVEDQSVGYSFGMSSDAVFEFLTASAEMSMLQQKLDRIYSSMSDEEKARLKSVSEYISNAG